MKMLFASDVHGNYGDADVLVRRINEERPDFVMLLGDFCGYAENGIFGELFGKIGFPYCYLRGNCDSEYTLIGYGFSPNAYLCSEKYGERRVYGSHGHIYNPTNLPSGIKKGDVFVYGHTHVPTIFYRDGITIVNCGSMSRPRMDETKTYAMLEGEFVYIKNSKGEIIKRGEII